MADPNIKDKYGSTLLHDVAGRGQHKIVESLLKAGADPNIQNVYGATPLLRAAGSKNLETVLLLLEAGADPNVQNNDGYSPFYEATTSKELKIVNALLKAGADPNLQDKWGRTPGHFNSTDEILMALIDHKTNTSVKERILKTQESLKTSKSRTTYELNKLAMHLPKQNLNTGQKPEDELDKSVLENHGTLTLFDFDKAERELKDAALSGYFNKEVLTVDVNVASEIKSGDGIYKMDSKPRGCALIINNTFQGKGNAERKGSEHDVNYLGSLCTKLGFEVSQSSDVTSKEFPNIMNQFREQLNDDMDAMVVAIMSHGSLNKIQMSDGKKLGLNKHILPQLFNDKFEKKNKSFKNKPKVLIIQACQNLVNDSDEEDDDDDDDPDLFDTEPTEGNYGEIHILLPCTHDVAKRKASTGSRFIYHLVEEVMKNGCEKNLHEMMINVTSKMKNGERPENSKAQIPCHHTKGVSKMLYFNPGRYK